MTRCNPLMFGMVVDFFPALGNAGAVPLPRSTMPAPTLTALGASFCQKGLRPTFRPGAIKKLGPLRSIAASIGANACRRIGDHRNRPPVAERGWKRPFDDPIPLPRGRKLVTLEDAGNYITTLPKAEHEAAEWQAAMEALILVATSGGPTMLARIGVMRALNRHVERVFNPDRKDTPIGESGN
jgi:hypothetical protein